MREINCERTAEAIIRSQEPFRAKHHKPKPMSDKDRKYAMEAHEAEKARLIAERIRSHTNSSFEDILGGGE